MYLSHGGFLRSFLLPCSPCDSLSGRINQGQDFSLLSGQVLGLPHYSSVLLGFLLLPFGFLSWSLLKSTLFASTTTSEIGFSGSFPSFYNFLFMSGAAWVLKKWANRTLHSILHRSAWVEFIQASLSLPKKLNFHSFPV